MSDTSSQNLRILVPADPDLYRWIDGIAREETLPRTAIVRRLLREARARYLAAGPAQASAAPSAPTANHQQGEAASGVAEMACA